MGFFDMVPFLRVPQKLLLRHYFRVAIIIFVRHGTSTDAAMNPTLLSTFSLLLILNLLSWWSCQLFSTMVRSRSTNGRMAEWGSLMLLLTGDGPAGQRTSYNTLQWPQNISRCTQLRCCRWVISRYHLVQIWTSHLQVVTVKEKSIPRHFWPRIR